MSYRQRVGVQIAAAQRDHEAVSQAFRRVFGSPEGHIVLDEIMRRCGVDAPLFNPNADVRTYNLGRRDVGLEIWRLASGERIATPEVKTNE